LFTHSIKPIKLSPRLRAIQQMVEDNYQHIWDTCCDHGMLGEALLVERIIHKASTSNNSIVHFVDIIPSIMARVTNKLQQYYGPWSNDWNVHCLDLANVPLDYYQGKHLLIISGISGELMASLIERFVNKHPITKLNNIEFLLCPAHGQLVLRKALIALNFTLNDEVLVEDNERFYEVIRVSIQNTGKLINPVGDKIWQYPTLSSRYLTKILNHYQRKQVGYHKSLMNKPHSQDLKALEETIKAYQAVKVAE
jgi:tRNA (adenine22-N1)-methyltransferase